MSDRHSNRSNPGQGSSAGQDNRPTRPTPSTPTAGSSRGRGQTPSASSYPSNPQSPQPPPYGQVSLGQYQPMLYGYPGLPQSYQPKPQTKPSAPQQYPGAAPRYPPLPQPDPTPRQQLPAAPQPTPGTSQRRGTAPVAAPAAPAAPARQNRPTRAATFVKPTTPPGVSSEEHHDFQSQQRQNVLTPSWTEPGGYVTHPVPGIRPRQGYRGRGAQPMGGTTFGRRGGRTGGAYEEITMHRATDEDTFSEDMSPRSPRSAGQSPRPDEQ